MAVLGDDRGGIEGSRRPQYRADIMRIGDLIEQQQRSIALLVQYLTEPDVGQGINIGDHALMRGIARNHPAEIRDIADYHGDIGRNFQRRQRLARDRNFLDHPIGIVERCLDRVPSPEFETATGFLD